MKKIIPILILAILFLNCETKVEKTEFKKAEFYYPRISYFKNTSNLINIYLDSIENYGELFAITNRIACNGQESVLKFSNDQSEFNLIVFKECSELNDIYDYLEQNVIFIEKNSIIINDKIVKHIDSLKTVLENHVLNPKKEFDYSQTIEKALILYYQRKSFSSKKIKSQLIRLVTEFNTLNLKHSDSLPLKVKLSEYPYPRIEKPPLLKE